MNSGEQKNIPMKEASTYIMDMLKKKKVGN
jgi:hypothetical protein